MTQENLGRRIWRNSASGYVRNTLRLLLGVVSFRLLCTRLSTEELGFYSLIWSFLGYGVLFDLGLGVAVKKRTAELIPSKSWDQLGRILSTVFFINCVRGLITIIIGYFAADELLDIIGASSQHREEFRSTIRIFAIGMAILFPLEMFREVHCGQQRISIVERLSTLGAIVSFVLLVCALQWRRSLPAILVLQFTCLILVDVLLAFSALRVMPEVRLRLGLVSRSVVRRLARFSSLAYVAAFAGIVLVQADRFLVGSMLSVSFVATYHIGAKIPELFATFSRQLPEALGPAAATVHGAEQHSNWQRLFLRGVRINALIATPLFLLCHIFLEPLLELLARGRASGNDIVVLARILLCWTYSTTLTHGIGKSVFLMCGHEAPLVRLLVAEALINIVASIVLLKWLAGPVGAALGSLVPALLFGWGFFWPWMAREMRVSSLGLARETLVPAWKAAIPLLCFAFVWRQFVAPGFTTYLLALTLGGIPAVAVSAFGIWRFALTVEERVFLRQTIVGYRHRRTARAVMGDERARSSVFPEGS